METFLFKGTSSSDMRVALQDIIDDGSKSAAIRYDRIDIDGRDGAIYIPLGYKDVDRDLAFTLFDSSKKDDVSAWLTGEGILQVRDRWRIMRVLSGVEFHAAYNIDVMTFNASVVLSPFWMSTDDWSNVDNGSYVDSVGTLPGAPMIRIRGSGAGNVRINDFVIGVDLPSSGGLVTINSAERTEDNPQYVNLGWKYPILNIGQNSVSFSGGVTKVEIKQRSRWV